MFKFKELRKKDFANGTVYALETTDGYPIEVTDTFLPFYTKDATGQCTNQLKSSDLGDRSERWMIGVSTMSGCPVGCKFCATGQLKRWRNLTWKEIVEQINFIVNKNNYSNPKCKKEVHPICSKEFKINYTRMGEPFLNLMNLRKAISCIDVALNSPLPKLSNGHSTHHYVSTVGLRGSDFSWIEDNVTLQISLHSLNEDRRRALIPINNLMTIEEIAQIRTNSKLKTTINLTLVDEEDFDIEKIKRLFDPAHFFWKISPVNPNTISKRNGIDGIVKANNLL